MNNNDFNKRLENYVIKPQKENCEISKENEGGRRRFLNTTREKDK